MANRYRLQPSGETPLGVSRTPGDTMPSKALAAANASLAVVRDAV